MNNDQEKWIEITSRWPETVRQWRHLNDGQRHELSELINKLWSDHLYKMAEHTCFRS